MQEVFEKIIQDKVLEKAWQPLGIFDEHSPLVIKVSDVEEIVKLVAAEYNNGWIPCSEPPKTDDYILLSFENFSVPLVGRYEEDETCISQDLFVSAWQPLPESYHTKGE